MKKITYAFVVISMATIFLFCKNIPVSKDGAQLAQSYCSTCHLYPEPSLLDQATWKTYILPRMANFMGIYQDEQERNTLLEQGVGGTLVNAANIYPITPTIEKEDWEAIQQFYLTTAPEELIPDSITQALETTSIFQPKFPDLFLSPPSTTLASIRDEHYYFSDANKQLFVALDKDLNIQKQAKVGEGLVQVHETPTDFWLTIMGSFSPSDTPKGSILQLSKESSKGLKKMITTLQRPVHSTYKDFNQDGLIDILICEYGKWTGALSLHLQQASGAFERKDIIRRSGAIKTEVIDFNQDGQLDILALFGQGDEGIFLFENKGNARFEAKPILRFHPSMGSSYFSLVDLNDDGKKDILYTAGDNADYPSLLKPYHGVYIFQQKENFTFEQTTFLPMHGAYKAIPADFDLDGDIDIAAISFFPDYEADSTQDFILFEKSQDHFTSKSLDLHQQGRWLIMDSGDPDQDGDEDLILGSLTFEVPQRKDLITTWVKGGLPFMVLENQMKK